MEKLIEIRRTTYKNCRSLIQGSLAYLIGLHQARSCSDKQSVKKIATILVLASEVAALGLGATAAMVSHKTICASKEHIKL